MTLRQKILKLFYPLLQWLGGNSSKQNIVYNKSKATPLVSFYSLSVNLNNGEPFSFHHLKGFKVLLINTASNCGYTAQYNQLQQLHTQYGNSLKVIGFPANDFKDQEQGNDTDIAAFCTRNFGVSFKLASKSHVIGHNKNMVFDWLSTPQKNGWCNTQPQWNFSKYLVDENGVLQNYFPPALSPLSAEVIKQIETKT